MEKLTDFKTYLSHLDQIAKTHIAISKKASCKFQHKEIYDDLLKSWKDSNWIFLETFDDGTLKFFLLVELYEDCYWLRYLYSHVRFRYRTKDYVNEVKRKLKARKDLPCFAETHILTPSYKRFAKSLNFFPYQVVYKCSL